MSESAPTQLTFGVLGSTQHTVWCAEALRAAGFPIQWVVTPTPRPVGRKQILTPTPLESWAKQYDIPVHHVEKKLSPLQDMLTHQPAPHYLLVVDFGYLVPEWLLQLPTIAPLNIHPSALPKYRGSSPAQYAILWGETSSEVCLMTLEKTLDTGPVIARWPLTITPETTQHSYYTEAFQLAAQKLPQTVREHAVSQKVTPQPEESPTPIAARLLREDGFLPFSAIERAQTESHAQFSPQELNELSPLLQNVVTSQNLGIAELVDRACRAFDPWPGTWTTVPYYKNRTQVRMKILSVRKENNLLQLRESQYDGEPVKKSL